jgi:hypothetical protein
MLRYKYGTVLILCRVDVTGGSGLPLLLTVEEAGAVLRIGRTKAYAMAREWRVTGGRSGLPVIDLGNVLRVPRRALEELIGAELTDVPDGHHPTAAADPPEATELTDVPDGHHPTAAADPVEAKPAVTPPRRSTRPRHRSPGADDEQLDLFVVRTQTL